MTTTTSSASATAAPTRSSACTTAEDLLRLERDLAVTLGTATSLDAALQAILDAALCIESVDAGGVYLFDPVTGELRLTAHRGLSPEFIASAACYDAADPHVDLVRSSEPIFGRYESVRLDHAPTLVGEGLCALAVIPVRHQGQTVAVLNAASHVACAFSETARAALVSVASRIGGAIARVQAHEEMRATEENFQAIVDSLRDFLFILDDEGRVVHVNRVVVERLGHAPIGAPVIDIHPAGRREEARCIVGEMLAGRLTRCPIPLITRTGQEIPVETVVSRGRWHGRPAIIGISRDVSRRAQAEEELARSVAGHRTLVEHAPIGIARLDCDGTLLDINPAFARLLGRSEDELRGEALASLGLGVGPEQIASVAGGRGNVATAEVRCERPDGAVSWVDVTLCAVREHDEPPIFLLSLANDVTARREAHASLEQLNADLERRVAERTAELQKANRAKDDFLASMSHELRTPLNGVLGLSEALQADVYGPITPRQETALQRIDECGQHLLKLITDVLDIAKIESGAVALERSRVSVNEVCEASLRMIQEASNRKRQRVSLQIELSHPTLVADERRLKQTLVNLLSNAVKFTPPRGTIGLRVQDVGATVRFTVSDTGIGIAPENLSRLFRPFVQVDTRLSREYSGTGLGLALVRRFVEMHGGEVSVESEAGQGSRFSVVLPRGDEAERL